MAKRTTVTLIDDIDHKSPAAETITFGIDGKLYEIDLSKRHAREFRKTVSPFVAAARRSDDKAPRPRAPRPRAVRPRPSRRGDGLTREERVAIRQWADDNDVRASRRGLMGLDVIARYNDAMMS